MAHICTQFRWSGSVVEVRVERKGFQSKVGGGRRGRITSWTARSRLRCWRAVASVEWEAVGPLVFVTLTYHVAPEDGRQAKGALRAFAERWRRRFGELRGVWKMEFQARGAVHFHLWLARPVEEIGSLRQWVAESWCAVSGGDEAQLQAGTSVEEWEGSPARYMAAYVRKCAKEYQHKVPEGYRNVGRWWGMWGVKPEWKEVEVKEDVFWRARRVLAKIRRARGSWCVVRGRYSGMWVVCQGAGVGGRMWQWLQRPDAAGAEGVSRGSLRDAAAEPQNQGRQGRP